MRPLPPASSSISRQASRSAVPLACVKRALTTNPLRFSISTWPMWHSWAAAPSDFLNSRQSGSVVERWVALPRFSFLKFTVALRVPSAGGAGGSSLRLKLLWEAQASISVPSTVKWSSESR